MAGAVGLLEWTCCIFNEAEILHLGVPYMDGCCRRWGNVETPRL